MGMRATISYVEESGKTFVTTLQWSTNLDQTLGHYAHSERENGASAQEAVKSLIKTATHNHGHLSAIEASDGENLRDNDIIVGNNVVLAGPQEKAYVFSTEGEARRDIDGHLDLHSLGAIYRESNPEVIEFFWATRTLGTTVKSTYEISALADFYTDVMGDMGTVLEMDFRKH